MALIVTEYTFVKGMPLLGDGTRMVPEPELAGGLALVSETVGAVVPGWLRPAPACHPKIWELVQYLKRYRYYGTPLDHP